MTKKEAPNNGANGLNTSFDYTSEPSLSQGWRIIEYLKKNLRLTTIDSRETLGIMNPAQRISELRKNGAPIKTDHTYQADVTGAVHRVAVYIWTGENSAQGDFFGGQFNGQ